MRLIVIGVGGLETQTVLRGLSGSSVGFYCTEGFRDLGLPKILQINGFNLFFNFFFIKVCVCNKREFIIFILCWEGAMFIVSSFAF